MTHDFELVAGVFEAARHLSGAARAAFLEERCEGNDGLLQEVQSLLSHGDADDGLSEDVLSDVRRRMSQVALQESAAAPLPTEVALPKRIGPYAVVRRLGAGGMGVVYEALQESPSRSVAVKVLRPLAAGESMLRRFEREGEILARLRHPGIAQIYATGTCDLGSGEQPYLAMELIEGSALNAYVKSQGLDTPGVVRLFAELCRALHHAHTQGVVHRDLKPENVLVEADGRPRILDFGIAHVIGHDERVETLRTADGDVIGTLDY
ncbi:MAG: serine/threonine-protein kinase, partial [Planctomycetota bacterium]